MYLFSALILSVLPYFSYSLPSNWLLQSHSNCIGDRPLKGCHGDQQQLMPHASLAFLTFAKALSLDISLALSSSFMRRCSSSTFPLHSIHPLIISHYFMRLDETHTHTQSCTNPVPSPKHTRLCTQAVQQQGVQRSPARVGALHRSWPMANMFSGAAFRQPFQSGERP